MKATERQKAHAREYYQAHKEFIRERGRRWYWENKEKFKESRLFYGLRYRENLKKEVLTHYSDGKCSCVRCGESRLACLSIDHIENNGAEHRREILRGRKDIYLWLRKNNYPEGYQTLCMNCQWVKKKEVSDAILRGRYRSLSR